MNRQRKVDNYVVVSDRGGKRLYLGDDNCWWDALENAKRFSEAGASATVRKNDIATGYVPLTEDGKRLMLT